MSKQQYITDNTNRLLAMEWWSKIPLIEREILWMNQTIVETHNRFAKNATGREIEAIWKVNKPQQMKTLIVFYIVLTTYSTDNKSQDTMKYGVKTNTNETGTLYTPAKYNVGDTIWISK